MCVCVCVCVCACLCVYGRGTPCRVWEQATIALLGEEEAATIAPQEKQFLRECLRVKREQGSSPAPAEGSSRQHARLHAGAGDKPSATTAFHLTCDARRRADVDVLRPVVEELLSTVAALQAREKEMERRINRLEQSSQRAPRSQKVASEFQRSWTGMTALAEKISSEMQRVQERLEGLEKHTAMRGPAQGSPRVQLTDRLILSELENECPQISQKVRVPLRAASLNG